MRLMKLDIALFIKATHSFYVPFQSMYNKLRKIVAPLSSCKELYTSLRTRAFEFKKSFSLFMSTPDNYWGSKMTEGDVLCFL